MPTIVLSPGGGSGLPEGSPEHRYEIQMELDGQGRPDVEVWEGAPAPWPARRFWPGDGLMQGEVFHDDDTGWHLRFYSRDDGPVDAPISSVLRNSGSYRPGEFVTVSEPDGAEYSWRIVGVE